MTLNDPLPDFKGTPLFDVDYTLAYLLQTTNR